MIDTEVSLDRVSEIVKQYPKSKNVLKILLKHDIWLRT